MTDREILDYSANIVSVKDEIESGEAAKPDLDEQIRNKLKEDSINRSRFIDASLVLSGASKEYRNVFGIEAPYYDIADCYLGIDSNDNDKIESGEIIDLKDSDTIGMSTDSHHFLDCWEVVNAARFDSTCMVSNGTGNGNDLPVNKQRFFVDYKKGEESSPLHKPFCPPGFDRWAGRYVYDHICRNYDLNEFTLYSIFSDIAGNSIPKSYNLRDDDSRLLSFFGLTYFSFNTNENGELCRNDYNYNFAEGETSSLLAKQKEDYRLPKGATPLTSSATHWYNAKIKVNSVDIGGGRYRYDYDYTGTIFEKSINPIAKITVSSRLSGASTNLLSNAWGVVILCRNPFQDIPREGTTYVSKFPMQYSVNLVYATDSFLGRTSLLINDFTLSPITNPTRSAKEGMADFVQKVEESCLRYYDMMKERGINSNLPDSENSLRLMKSLVTACKNYKKSNLLTESSCWKKFIKALKNRAVYDIFNEVRTGSSVDNIFTDSETNTASLNLTGRTGFITGWYMDYVPKKIFGFITIYVLVRKPSYTSIERYKINANTTFKSPRYANCEYKYVKNYAEYFGPRSGDITKYGGTNRANLKTLEQLLIGKTEYVTKVLEDGTWVTEPYWVPPIIERKYREYLYSKGIIDSVDNPTWIILNGTKRYTANTSMWYEFIFEETIKEEPTYDNMARAATLNDFLSKSSNLYYNAFNIICDRIDKRTGTLRKACNLLDSANINSQMIESRKESISNLFDYMNAYTITGGFGTNTISIKLATWEPYTTAYANLGRMDTVYLLSDITTIQTKEGDEVVNKFSSDYVKAVITEVIDMAADAEYNYNKTDDIEVKPDKVESGLYYTYNTDLAEYVVVTTISDAEEAFNSGNLYEKGAASKGAIFNVTLDSILPESFRDRNPRLVKVY